MLDKRSSCKTFDFGSNMMAHSTLHDLHETRGCTMKGVKGMYVLALSDGFHVHTRFMPCPTNSFISPTVSYFPIA